MHNVFPLRPRGTAAKWLPRPGAARPRPAGDVIAAPLVGCRHNQVRGPRAEEQAHRVLVVPAGDR